MPGEIINIQIIDKEGNTIKSNYIPKKEAIKRMSEEIFGMIQIVYEDISSDMARNAAHVALGSLFDKESKQN